MTQVPGSTDQSSNFGDAVRRLVRTSAAISTPFDERDHIDWEAFTQHAKWLLKSNITSVTLFGTTGEGSSLSLTERHQALDILSNAGIALASTIYTARGLAALEIASDCAYALRAGCGAVLLAPPVTVGGLENEGILRWYRSVFDHLDAEARDIILYHIPSVTGVELTNEVVTLIRQEFPGVVVGVKVSSTDWGYLNRLLNDHKDLAIIASHEAHLARAISLGASGTISGLANFQPAIVCELAKGRDDNRVLDLIKLVLSFPPVPTLKDLLAFVSGQDQWLRMRAPMTQLSASDRKSLRDAYGKIFPSTNKVSN